jgi:hypothetical protein
VPSGFPDYEYFEIPLPVAQGGTGLTQWPGARVYNSADETVPNAIPTRLTFDSERYDNGGLHSTVTNPSRLTAQKAGKYNISGHVQFLSNASGYRWVEIFLNGTTVIARQAGPALSGPATDLSVSTTYHLAVNDYVELWVYQNSGGNLDVVAVSAGSPEFAMQWVGP